MILVLHYISLHQFYTIQIVNFTSFQFIIAQISDDDFLWLLISTQIKIEGFIVTRWESEFPAACKQVVQWIKEVRNVVWILRRIYSLII